MNIYVVTYDISDSDRREQIQTKLKQDDDTFVSKMLCESSYFIETSMTAEQIYSLFQQFLIEGDAFFVIPIGGSIVGQHENKLLVRFIQDVNKNVALRLKSWQDYVRDNKS